MKRLCAGLALALVMAVAVAGWMLTHHVVRTRHGTAVLEKRFLTFEQTWVDARAWAIEDFDANPAVKRAFLNAGYDELLSELRREQIDTSAQKLAAETDEAVEALKDFITEKIDEWLGEMEKSTSTNNSPPAAPGPAADAGD
jgi:hypothetical protein